MSFVSRELTYYISASADRNRWNKKGKKTKHQSIPKTFSLLPTDKGGVRPLPTSHERQLVGGIQKVSCFLLHLKIVWTEAKNNVKICFSLTVTSKIIFSPCHSKTIFRRIHRGSESTQLTGAQLKAVFGPRPTQTNIPRHMEKRVLDDITEIWESRQDSKESARVLLGPNFAEVSF